MWVLGKNSLASTYGAPQIGLKIKPLGLVHPHHLLLPPLSKATLNTIMVMPTAAIVVFSFNTSLFSLSTYFASLIASISCKELKAKNPDYPSALYALDASSAGIQSLIVFCDMDTDGGLPYSFIHLYHIY